MSKSNKPETSHSSESKGKKKKVKKIKLPKTSKSGKIGFKGKFKNFTSKQRVKLTRFSSKAKNQMSEIYSTKIAHQEIYIQGEEPKSYSFKRRFYGLYVIFIVYSLLLIIDINVPGSYWINILMLGNPFAFSNAIVAFFLVLSFLLSIDRVRIFIFEEKTVIKQLLIYGSIIAVLYLLFLYIGTNINFLTYL